MSKITLYIGMNVQRFQFQLSHTGPEELVGSTLYYNVGSTHRVMIEEGLHPQKIAEKVLKDIKHCSGNFDLHISTHSDVPLNLIGHLIHDKIINKDDVKIVIMSDDNTEIESVSSYDEKGFLLNWPYGFFEFDANKAIRNVKFSLNESETKIEN